MRLATALAAILVIPSVCFGADDFPQFRGPLGWGVAPAANVPDEWSAESNLAWKSRIPGSGWSQPVLFGGHVYLTSAVTDKTIKPQNFSEGVKSPRSMGLGILAKAPSDVFEWQVVCLDAESGNLIWKQSVGKGKAKYAIHPSNSFATETPVADADGLYVYFGAAGILARVDHSGTVVWTKEFEVFRTSNNFGTGSSLAIHDGHIFLQTFSEKAATVRAIRTDDGGQAWMASRKKASTSWSSPLVWANEVRTELIISGDQQVESFNPSTGEVLWKVSNVKAATACSPAADQKRLYFGGSDPFSKGPLFAIRAGASGDISPRKNNARFEYCSWLVERAAPGMASPVSSGQHVYVVDKNILRCYDAESGERVYQSRVPGLTMVASSPLIIGDRLLLIDEAGRAAMVSTGSEFQVRGQGRFDDTFWSTPAVSGDAIFFRGVEGLYCVRKTAGSQRTSIPVRGGQ